MQLSDRALSMPEACQMLSMDRHTVLKYINQGTLSGKRLPSDTPNKGHWRIMESSIILFLQPTHKVAAIEILNKFKLKKH